MLSLLLVAVVGIVFLVAGRMRVQHGSSSVAESDKTESGDAESGGTAERYHDAIITTDSTSLFTINSVTGEAECFAIRQDGTVAVSASVSEEVRIAVAGWTDIVQLASTRDALFGLQARGTVSYCVRPQETDYWAETDYQQVSTWRNVKKLVVTDDDGSQIFGLKNDGTVYCAGYEGFGNSRIQDVSDWSGIVDLFGIRGIDQHLCGLREDGTLLTLNWSTFEWSGTADHISSVACGKYVWLALKEDGSVILSGVDAGIAADDIAGWSGIVQVAAGASRAAGLKADGTVVTAGFTLENPSEWRNVTDIQMDQSDNLYGIRSDGTVCCFLQETSGPVDPAVTEEISDWSNVQKLIFGRGGQVLALCRDGSLLGSMARELS